MSRADEEHLYVHRTDTEEEVRATIARELPDMELLFVECLDRSKGKWHVVVRPRDELSRPYAVYRLAPIGVGGAMEAEDVAHWACSRDHAKVLADRMSQPYGCDIGPNNDYVEGTICELCFTPLTTPAENV